MRYFSIISALCLMTLTVCTSCKSKAGDEGGGYNDYFEKDSPVDLSDILKIYKLAEKDDMDYDLSTALEGDKLDSVDGYFVFSDASPAISLPQYADSKQPFLACAEEFYNSCMLAYNVWTNHDLWLRGEMSETLVDKADLIDGIKNISADCIINQQARMAANDYKDSILWIMNIPYEDWDGDINSGNYLNTYIESIESRAYQFYTDDESFTDSLETLSHEFNDMSKSTIEKYKKADEDARLEMMLVALNNCDNFDEQCSLLINWANCKESSGDDEWIIAVAERLIDSGKYNPYLCNIWIIWRCMFQIEYCGMSRDSSIPNGFYNTYRQKCYLTCLKRIEQHPQDVFAMNCAAVIGGRININRYGQNYMGNEAAIDKYIYLYGRYESDDEESSDDDVDYAEDEDTYDYEEADEDSLDL